MDTVEIVIGADGRIESPRGVRLRVPAELIVREVIVETDEERTARFEAFHKETDELLKDVPVKELCDCDPRVAKYRRMGLLD